VNALAAPPLSWSRPSSPPWIGVHSTSSGYILVRDPVAAVGLALLGCVLIMVYATWVRRASWAVALGVRLQAGGALSNLLDRLLHTGVTDYLNVSPSLTFNLADVFLFVGMVLAMAGIAAGLLRSPCDFGPERRQATHRRPGQAGELVAGGGAAISRFRADLLRCGECPFPWPGPFRGNGGKTLGPGRRPAVRH